MTPTMNPTVALPSVYREAIADFETGKSPETVLNNLIEKGLPEQYARRLMDAALNRFADFGTIVW